LPAKDAQASAALTRGTKLQAMKKTAKRRTLAAFADTCLSLRVPPWQFFIVTQGRELG
jgi:hypothetical protein